jgi:hypothetical protein
MKIKDLCENTAAMVASTNNGFAGGGIGMQKRMKTKKKRKVGEKAPPGREKQVKKLKGKFDDPGAPYAIAWAQHNKHGKPKKK